MYKFLNQKGQALLIVVLAMVVALTVGLSVVSRSITNLKNSQQQISSQQALSAAEAGIEQAIKSGTNVANPNFASSTSYQTSIATVSGTATFLLNGNNQVTKDDAIYIWLTPYSTDPTNLFLDKDSWSGSLDLYWGDSATACNNAALEIAVISGTRAIPLITKYAYDPCDTRVLSNSFSKPDSVSANQSVSGVMLYDKSTISITNGFLVRVGPLYTDSYVGVLGTGVKPLPSQGSIITSTGTITSAGSSSNSVVRKLNVFQGYPEVPAELFPFSIFWP